MLVYTRPDNRDIYYQDYENMDRKTVGIVDGIYQNQQFLQRERELGFYCSLKVYEKGKTNLQLLLTREEAEYVVNQHKPLKIACVPVPPLSYEDESTGELKGILPPGVFIPVFEKNGFIGKLDLRFLSTDDPYGRAEEILHMVIEMGNEMGLSVLAEDVETKDQKEMLREFNCNKAQGYYYARPMNQTSYLRLLENNKKIP